MGKGVFSKEELEEMANVGSVLMGALVYLLKPKEGKN